MFDLNAYLTAKNRQINEALGGLLGNTSGRIISAMRHSLMAGGKRIRPVLCIAASEAVGAGASDALPAACAIEMIHTYSLIHDDLPAMDDDAMRRGKPTCHVAFDEATAILAGDALLTMAFEVLSSVETEGQIAERLAVVGILARAAGYQGMIEGQMRDIAAEGTSLDLKALREMHALKTGALIEASVTSGGNNPKYLQKRLSAGPCSRLIFLTADQIRFGQLQIMLLKEDDKKRFSSKPCPPFPAPAHQIIYAQNTMFVQ